ncbi:hypothetical protein [Reichenbachiella sp.]|uniref:hypothetical protein n=1 Tax=Reichenbachiella sp. TaxID=2184521 RepID=UPI003BAF5B6B
MSRQIINASPPAATATMASPTLQPDPDKYKDRLLKYIPGEIIALWITGTSVLTENADKFNASWHWAFMAICAILCVVYLKLAMKVDKPIQLVVSVLCFVVWVFTLGGPFLFLDWYDPIYGQFILPIFTITVGFIKP